MSPTFNFTSSPIQTLNFTTNNNMSSLAVESLWSRSYHQLMSSLLHVWSLISPYLTPPLLLLFFLPFLLCLLFYFSAFAFYLHQKNLPRLLSRWREAVLNEHDLLKAGREIIATWWDFQGWIWFGYEVHGLENIPPEGAAMVIYYHGALPVDYYYFVAKLVLVKQRVVHSVVDRFLFRIPGLRTFLHGFNCTPGSVESCAAELEAGHLLGLSPGGVYEAQFSSPMYDIQWKQRCGFARIALKARCPVIPMFTQNVRESFRGVGFLRSLCQAIYDRTRVPTVPLYGGFPVKLTTYVGEPIDYDPDKCTPEQLRDKCKQALQKLIDEHQQRPGSIYRALLQRFSCMQRTHEN